MGVRGSLGEALGALRESILSEKVVFGKCARRRGAEVDIGYMGRPVAAPCASGAVRDVPRRLRNVLRGKEQVQKSQQFHKMCRIFEFPSEKCRFS